MSSLAFHLLPLASGFSSSSEPQTSKTSLTLNSITNHATHVYTCILDEELYTATYLVSYFNELDEELDCKSRVLGTTSASPSPTT